MKIWNGALRLYVIAWAAFLGLAISTASNASTVYDLRSGGDPATEMGSGYGNVLDFGDFTATAWAATGYAGDSNDLNDAQIGRFSTGLGSCNRQEGVNCSSPTHQVDNFYRDDFVLFTFDQQQVMEEIVIDPFGRYDRDVTFWIADIAIPPSLYGLDPNDLNAGTTVFGTATTVNNSPSNQPITVALGGGTGNALLFAASTTGYHDDDRFKIASLTTTVVPVPPAVWLFGSGLLGLIGISRRRK